MRFLIPGPAFEDSFADNVASTLREMGHEVTALREGHAGAWALPRELLRMVGDRLRSFQPSPADRAVLARAKELRPDVLLALTWDVHPEILRAIGQVCPGRRILWWADAPANSRRWGLANPEWDKVYVKDPEALPKLRLLGTPADLLHEAMNPRWHRPVATQANGDLVIVGNAYGSRQALVRRLHRDGIPVALYGPPPPAWSFPETQALHRRQYVTREAKSRVFGEGLACLNTTSFAEGSSLNCRAFEVAGSGGLQLIEARPIVESCFEPGREVLTFQTYEELNAHLERARRAPSEMVAIREAGARRALAEHTYAHRLQRIIREVTS